MNTEKFVELISQNQDIVIIQADNPDGDSLASALALESLLANQSKNVYLYCGVDIPGYLKYLTGWERVSTELPNKFGLAIILDTSAISLLESLVKNNGINKIKKASSIIIDHHSTEPTIDFANTILNIEASSTGEVLYKLSEALGWEINSTEAEFLAYAILSDTLGLSTENVNEKTMIIMAGLLKRGVNIAKLNEVRQKYNKKSKNILKYKAELLSRIKYSEDDLIASIVIPFEEIEKYSHEYNPPMLVMDEMRMVEKVLVSVAFKTYPDGKLTAKIRTNLQAKIADKIAEHFGGGGHGYAAGFKITDGRKLESVMSDFDNITHRLLEENGIKENDETIQYTY